MDSLTFIPADLDYVDVPAYGFATPSPSPRPARVRLQDCGPLPKVAWGPGPDPQMMVIDL